MRTLSWRKSLPAIMVVVSVSLVLLMDHDYNSHRNDMAIRGIVADYDYLPPALIWLIVINAPAFVVVLPLGMILAKWRITSQIASIVCIALFWYLLGREIDNRSIFRQQLAARRDQHSGIWLYVAGLLGGALLASFSIYGYLDGAWPKIIDSGALVWAVCISGYSVSQIRRFRPKRSPVSS